MLAESKYTAKCLLCSLTTILFHPISFYHRGQIQKIAAIIDWEQAGWYPAYWEYCKARRVRVDPEYFDDAVQEEWHTKYLPMIMDPVDDDMYYNPWLWFVLSKGI